MVEITLEPIEYWEGFWKLNVNIIWQEIDVSGQYIWDKVSDIE